MKAKQKALLVLAGCEWLDPQSGMYILERELGELHTRYGHGARRTSMPVPGDES
jgi:hypothetical protein